MYNVSNTIKRRFSLMWQSKVHSSISQSVVAFLHAPSQGPRLPPSCHLPPLVARLSLHRVYRRGKSVEMAIPPLWCRRELVTRQWPVQGVWEMGSLVGQLLLLREWGPGVKMDFECREATICTWDSMLQNVVCLGAVTFYKDWNYAYVKSCDKS